MLQTVHLSRRAHTHIFSRWACHILLMRTLHGSRCFRVKRVRVIVLCSLPSRSLMSFRNIPHCSFQQVLSSPTCSRSRPRGPVAGVGCLAEWLTQLQTQVMRPTPPTSSATWTQRTRRSISQTATATSSARTTLPRPLPQKIQKVCRIQEHPAAAKQQQNSRKQSSFKVRTSKPLKQMADHVSGRPGLQESGAISDRESCATAIFSLLLKGERDRDTSVMHSMKDRENLVNNPRTESWLGLPRRDDVSAKLVWSWGWVEARNWEKRNSDFPLKEISQEFESQRFQLHQASRWVDQAQRDKIGLYGELELRNRLFQENHASTAKKFKNWEVFVAKKLIERDKQEVKNCLCNNRGILRLWVRWWLKFGI